MYFSNSCKHVSIDDKQKKGEEGEEGEEERERTVSDGCTDLCFAIFDDWFTLIYSNFFNVLMMNIYLSFKSIHNVTDATDAGIDFFFSIFTTIFKQDAGFFEGFVTVGKQFVRVIAQFIQFMALFR